MDESGGTRFEGLNPTVRKKRSHMLRRPRPEKPFFHDSRDQSPLTPVSDDFGRVSSDENIDDASAGRKMFNLNHCMSRGSASRVADGGSSLLHSNGVPGDDTYPQHGSSLRQPGTVQDGVGSDSKLKKVKLKVGGVTRTIQTKTDYRGAYGGGLSTTSARALDGSLPRQKLTPQDTLSKDGLSERKSGLQGILSRDSPKGSFAAGMGKMPVTNAYEKGGDKSDPSRKSKRVPKRRVSEWFDEDDKDDEIRYLEKLKTSKIAGYKDFEEELTNKRSLSRVSRVSRYEKDENVGRSRKDVRKKSEQGSEDIAYEVEELLSDGEPEGKKKQKQRKESSDSSNEGTRGEMTLTTRQRALLSSKDSSASSVSQIEFPNGLPPAPPRKQKEKLTEVEQQLKKAEAAQKRRMQNEKAARESEAEAIRKILGQDSNRKKKEDKMKKRQEELAQEKAAKEQMLAKSTVRVVMGPTGTVVTFPEDMGLPHIFNSKPCSYPPPREKCAGPSCVNPYKYRDSKTKLPLCSLQCYKAIHEKGQA
ncbi:uncharacterized protein LOC132644927 [Lycium barbarum]|uniref:uncharacterized protein LOC132644927 n=1 Tax=Lycium barbarum TaxID=112863 RepID=UPI00293EF7F3|nr:uncharacterized protein LOC132644927 [Lycium barbarum]XP_060217580.1 uncharacterized protein LOC132644927 [Lycium barbarum]XP_060217581.1 uncharacterized protein LOC132644927 [Lycium barbarum]